MFWINYWNEFLQFVSLNLYQIDLMQQKSENYFNAKKTNEYELNESPSSEDQDDSDASVYSGEPEKIQGLSHLKLWQLTPKITSKRCMDLNNHY